MSSWSEPGIGRWLAGPGHAPLTPGGVVCLPRPEDGLTPFARWPMTVPAESCASTNANSSPDTIPLYRARYPADREPAWWHTHATIEQQAADLAQELRDREATAITVFGHGVSALVAYEAAAELTRTSSWTINRLIVSDCPAPTHAGTYNPPPTDDEALEHALVISVESGASPLPSPMEKTVRALFAQAAALRAYHPTHPAKLDLDLCVVRWHTAPGSRRRPDSEACDHASMADWAACGAARFFDLDAAPTTFVEPPAELLRILAGTHREWWTA
jgi:hypothetical protein